MKKNFENFNDFFNNIKCPICNNSINIIYHPTRHSLENGRFFIDTNNINTLNLHKNSDQLTSRKTINRYNNSGINSLNNQFYCYCTKTRFRGYYSVNIKCDFIPNLKKFDIKQIKLKSLDFVYNNLSLSWENDTVKLYDNENKIYYKDEYDPDLSYFETAKKYIKDDSLIKMMK